MLNDRAIRQYIHRAAKSDVIRVERVDVRTVWVSVAGGIIIRQKPHSPLFKAGLLFARYEKPNPVKLPVTPGEVRGYEPGERPYAYRHGLLSADIAYYSALDPLRLIPTPFVWHGDYGERRRMLVTDDGDRVWLDERHYELLGHRQTDRRRVRLTLHDDRVLGTLLGEIVCLFPLANAETEPGYDHWDDVSDLLLMKRGEYVLHPEPVDEPGVEDVAISSTWLPVVTQ